MTNSKKFSTKTSLNSSTKNPISSIKRQRQQQIASKRPKYKWVVELISMTFFIICFLLAMSHGYSLFNKSTKEIDSSLIQVFLLFNTILLAFVGGLFLSDFTSGVIHWFCDTYFSIETPVIGPAFIRSFREHHVDPQEICKHSFLQTNADNCLLALVAMFFFTITTQILFIHILHISSPYFLSIISFFNASFGFGLSATNQIHAWSHARYCPPLISHMQKYKLLLGRQAHNMHHIYPFDRSYCITTGWANPLLDSISFWRVVESIIEILTGVKARTEDMDLNAFRHE